MAIKVVFKQTEAPAPIPEGVYKAALVEVLEDTGDFGDYLKLTFEITDGEQEGTTRTMIASKKFSKSKGRNAKASKLYDVVKALTKIEPDEGQELDVEDLIGKPCQIFIKDGKEKDGIVFQEISAVMPAA